MKNFYGPLFLVLFLGLGPFFKLHSETEGQDPYTQFRLDDDTRVETSLIPLPGIFDQLPVPIEEEIVSENDEDSNLAEVAEEKISQDSENSAEIEATSSESAASLNQDQSPTTTGPESPATSENDRPLKSNEDSISLSQSAIKRVYSRPVKNLTKQDQKQTPPELFEWSKHSDSTEQSSTVRQRRNRSR